MNDEISTVPQYRRPYDYRKGPLRLWNTGRHAMIQIGPLKLNLHLHVHPSERTDKAAFEIQTKVNVRILLGDLEIYSATLFDHVEKWGLCVRIGDEWKKKAS